MADELEKLLNGGEAPREPLAEKAPEKSEDEIRKETQLANLNKAILEANDSLKKIRQAAKAEKAGVSLRDLEEEELPRINLEDPNSRAWDRHMADKVNPLQSELEKERDEVTALALREFLADKPALAANQDRLKDFVRDYQALATARGITGRNKDVVKSVMDSAYGSVFHDEVLAEARRTRVAAAQADSILADVATDTGSDAPARTEHQKRTPLNKEMREAVIAMYGSEDAYWKTLEKVQGS